MPQPSLSFDTPDLAQHYGKVSQDRPFKAGQLLLADLQLKAGVPQVGARIFAVARKPLS